MGLQPSKPATQTPEEPKSSTTPSLSPTIASHLSPSNYTLPAGFYLTRTTPGFPCPIARDNLVGSAAVLHTSDNTPRILLLQRAAHSSQPLLWELPGGRCEGRDQHVIATAVRELWEETGLVATNVRDVAGLYEWDDTGDMTRNPGCFGEMTRWRKVVFLVDVEGGDGEAEDGRVPEVVIDPKEQAGCLWATAEEVRRDRCGEVGLEWGSGEMKECVLRAFEVVKGRKEEESAGVEEGGWK